MIYGADSGRTCRFHIGNHVLQIQKKIVPKRGVPAGGGDVFMPACHDDIGGLLKGGTTVGSQCVFQIFGGVFKMAVDVIGGICKLCPFCNAL